MKTKIGGIESPMFGASYASKISQRKSPMWNPPGGRLRRKIAKKGQKKAIFGGFKVLAKSGVKVLQNNFFSCQVQSIFDYNDRLP